MNIDKIVYRPLRPLSFRGKYRLSNIIVPKYGSRSARIFGYSMELDLADHIQRSIYAGLYEVEEADWVRSVLKPGMTFVDIGANVGYYTALAASVVGKLGRVIAFEPESFAFSSLDRFVKLNGLSQVECHPIGLSDQEGRLALFVPPKSYGNHNPSTNRYCSNMTACEISVTTLDSVLELCNLGCIDLMKVDVEGHELRVLKGAQRSIQQGRIKNILCEFNEKMLSLAGTSTGSLHQWLLTAGFEDLDRAREFSTTTENRRFVLRSSHY